MYAEFVKHIDYQFDSALDFTFGIRVLDPEEEYSSGLVRESFVSQSTVKVAEMNESRWTRSETRDLCPFREIPGRIRLLHVVRYCVDIGIQQICQIFVIHV